jgi:transglutaminase-like putative cysteine protease
MSTTFSPDGKWMWNGTEWIPSPPVAEPTVVQSAQSTIQQVAHATGVPVETLTQMAPNFDINNDKSLDQSEMELAASAYRNPPSSPYIPIIKSTEKRGSKKIVASIVVIMLVATTSFWMLSPDFSPISSIHDTDGDGFTDSDDAFKFNSSEWADQDNDGVGDNADAFPNDSNETLDSDKDGFGDNQDDCPDIAGTSELDKFGCIDADGDGISDSSDEFPNDSSEWADLDSDGFGDNLDACPNVAGTSFSDRSGCLDSDSDGFSDTQVDWTVEDGGDAFPTDTTQWRDIDGDGYGDNVLGNNPDLFPQNPNEWADSDGDGIGDNTDIDDDNDLVPDVDDLNPNRDAAVFLNFSLFTVYEYMDYFDNYAEVYLCVYVNSLEQGCIPDQSTYWSLETGITYSLDTSYFIDLDESIRYHSIEVYAWDSDAWEDDLIDISSDPDWSSHLFVYDSVTSLSSESYVADGTLDSTGWDGVLEYSMEPFDNRNYRGHEFTWDYDNTEYSLYWSLDYSTYAQSRALPHDIDWSGASTLADVVDEYAAFAVTDQAYVIELATELKNMAIQNGYTTELEIAEFIYAFVGDIQYQLDSIDYGDQEYPKFPIEMLWEQNGDCEDAALLYISLTESIGEVKSSSDEEWGGHAWAVIFIPDHSGDGWYGLGSKSEVPYYFVEATAHYDGSSMIGRNPWYDVQNHGFYDVE